MATNHSQFRPWRRALGLLLAVVLAAGPGLGPSLAWAAGAERPRSGPQRSGPPVVPAVNALLNALHAASLRTGGPGIDTRGVVRAAQPGLSAPFLQVAANLSPESRAKFAYLVWRAQESGLDLTAWTPAGIEIKDRAKQDASSPAAGALDGLESIDRALAQASWEELRDPIQISVAAGRIWHGIASRDAQANPPAVEAAPSEGFSEDRRSQEFMLSPASARDGAAPGQAEAVPSPAWTARVSGPEQSRRLWETGKAWILSDSRLLRARLDEFVRRREGEIGAEAFADEVERDLVVVEDPLLGRAGMTAVDGRMVVRVTHAPTELALLFLDRRELAPDSRHLRKVVARQHLDSGRHRKDKQGGRDVVILWEEGARTVSEEVLLRHRPASRGWWGDYWHATVKKPTQGDLVLGVLCGAAQGILAFTLSHVKLWLGASGGIDFFPIVYTSLFGTFIGIFSSTYLNWTYRGAPASQLVKSAFVSFLFAYPVTASTHGIASLSLLTLAGWLTHAHVVFNVFLNNLGKVAWQQLSKLGRDNRKFTKPLPLGINRASAVNQSLYLINWTLRLGDLIGIPLGKVIFLASIPVARWLVLKYAEKHNFPETPDVRRAWERDKDRILGFPKRLYGWVAGGLGAALRFVSGRSGSKD